MEAGAIGLDLAVELQDRVPGPHIQVLLQPFIGPEGKELLRTSGNHNLVLPAQSDILFSKSRTAKCFPSYKR